MQPPYDDDHGLDDRDSNNSDLDYDETIPYLGSSSLGFLLQEITLLLPHLSHQ